MIKNKKILLEVIDLHATVNGIPILKGVNLKVNEGEIHVIMGPNGSGKSTFSKVLAGHPAYKITKGKILFKGLDISKIEPEERSHLVCLGYWMKGFRSMSSTVELVLSLKRNALLLLLLGLQLPPSRLACLQAASK